jgi:uncharacterized repeat protein (TIGR01451 family)
MRILAAVIMPMLVMTASSIGWGADEVEASEQEIAFEPHTIYEYPIWWPSQLTYPADMDGDGDLDVIASTRDGGLLWFVESSGGIEPTFTVHVIDETGATRAVFPSDFNGDGRMDLLAAASADGSGELRWYENAGGQPLAFIKHVISSAGSDFYAAEAGDIDGDGDADIAAFHLDDFGSKPLMTMWFENRGGRSPTFVEHQLVNVAGWNWDIHISDLDGDGDQDIVQTGSTFGGVGGIVWQAQIGPKQFQARIIADLSGDVRMAAPPWDADGDGDLDLMIAFTGPECQDSRFAWYENDGAAPPQFHEHLISSAGEVEWAGNVYPGDIDGDGDIDAAVAYQSDCARAETGTFGWYENTGASPPTFTLHVIGHSAYPALFQYAGAHRVTVSDINADGAPDILAQEVERVLWYENTALTPRQADLIIGGRASPLPARVGQGLTYTWTVANAGGAKAMQVMLRHQPPASVRVVSLPKPCKLVGVQTVRCCLGSLAPGAEKQIKIVVRPTQTGFLINRAWVYAAENDLNPADNAVTIKTSVSAAR